MRSWSNISRTLGAEGHARANAKTQLSTPMSKIEVKHKIRSQADDPIRPLHLSEDEVRLLTRQSNGLFIWCKTLFMYLRDSPFSPRAQLKAFLENTSNRGKVLEPLYDLYDEVLRSSPRLKMAMHMIPPRTSPRM